MTSLYFASKKLSALGLRFHVTGAVFLRLLALAGLGHCPAPRWWRIIPLVAPWRLSGYQVLDFITRKGFVFQQTLGQRFPILLLLFQDFGCRIIGLINQAAHFRVNGLEVASETVFDWETE